MITQDHRTARNTIFFSGKKKKVSGLRVVVGWRIATWSGAWWDIASRGLLGHIKFHVEVLRPVSVGVGVWLGDDGDESAVGVGAAGGVSDVKQWEVVHETDVPFESGHKDLLDGFVFQCVLTDQELGACMCV